MGVRAPRAGAALAIALGLATALSPAATTAYTNHPATETIRLMAVGDMELAFGVGRRIVADGEYRFNPKRSQRRMADAAIGAGAALVVGHGAHVLQGYRSGDHTLIAYGLGNFVLPGYDGAAKDSAILDVTLSAQGVESFSWIPIFLERALPRPAVGSEIDRILARLRPL